MRKTVLLIILIIGYYLPSFTQKIDLKRSNQMDPFLLKGKWKLSRAANNRSQLLPMKIILSIMWFSTIIPPRATVKRV